MGKPIKIAAGENIPYIQEAFGRLGELTLLPGRSMTAADLKEADILLIRSITRVDENLLKGTPIAFVGSASAGINHIDEAYLQSRNIGFASAAGSNANSVAEYVIASLLLLWKRRGFSLRGKSIGIVGVGNIGRLVKLKAEALGMQPVLNDPPLAESGQIDHRPLKEVLGCDIVSLHTPFTTTGPYPTYHLLNEQTCQWLNPSGIFINAARGEVVDTHAFLTTLSRTHIGPTIIDVWEHEPDINWNLFNLVTIGTPHIAGHSLDGKANGTFMIYAAVCKHLGIAPEWNPIHSLPPPTVPSIKIEPGEKSDEAIVGEVVARLYDMESDHRRMQEISTAPQGERPRLFDGLRKHYPVRREFQRTRVILPTNREKLRQMLSEVGFTDITAPSQEGP